MLSAGEKHIVCKCHAPWPMSSTDYVKQTGEWGPKREYRYVVEWNPATTVCACCNNNIKVITNGSETLNLSFYFTMYPAKKQNRNVNMSLLLADSYMYHLDHSNPWYIDNIAHNQSLMLFQLLNTLNCEQVMGGQMAISLLIG